MARPFAVEASWVTSKWDKLDRYIAEAETSSGDFNIDIGSALLALHNKDFECFQRTLDELRQKTARSMSVTNTMSFEACHDAMLKFHVLSEVESISCVNDRDKFDKRALMVSLNQRINNLGAFSADKQYLLGIRRAAMQLSR